MKIHLSLFFFCLAVICKAQDYLPMLENDHVWNVVSVGGPEPIVTKNLTYEIVGTEVVNNTTYQLISRDNCLLREENGVVYRYNPNTNSEDVYMDFTLEVGDIFTFSDSCEGERSGNMPEIELVNTYTEEIANEERLILDFTIPGTTGNDIVETWIEGIGSLQAFEPGNYDLDFTAELSCFTSNSETTFFNDFNLCPVLAVDEFETSKVKLAPNPVTHTSILQFPTAGIVDRIDIFDISGKKLSSTVVSEDHVLINARDYLTGVYFYKIFSGNDLIKSNKFIIK